MVKRKQVQPPLSDEMLEVTIDELRRAYDWVSHMYDKVKSKTLTFLGGGLALLIFLYSGGNLFFPSQVYGQIFYVIGLGLVVCSLVMLFVSTLPRTWLLTVDSKDMDDMNFEDDNHYLQYVKNNYMEAYKFNKNIYEKNGKMLNLSFFPLVIGAIILVVLKIFGA